MTAGKAGRIALTLGSCLLILPACGGREPADPIEAGQGPPAGPPRDEIPPGQLPAVIEAHYRGLGEMERYEYDRAADAFRDAHARAPGWIAGSINLGLALLNKGGVEKEKAKSAGQIELEGAPKRDIDEAEKIFDDVLARDPKNLHALFSRGIILRDQGRMVEAYRDFKAVTEADPGDANAWFERGSALTDPESDGMPNERKQARELIEYYGKALECNPYLTTAMFKLQAICQLVGDGERRKQLYAKYESLNPRRNAAGSGEVAALVYGEMGKYARVIDPFPRPRAPEKPAPPPRFGPANEIEVRLPEGSRWATSADFAGPLAVVGRARARLGAGVATFDADGDHRADLYLTAAVVGPRGVRDALLLNRGEGKFEDVTVAWGLPEDRAGLGVAAGDFDADRRVDLFLTGVGDNRLFRNLGGKFEDVTARAGIDGKSAISPTARWLDLDQDGDLDLYVLNYSRRPPGVRRPSKGPPARPAWPTRPTGMTARPAEIAHRPEDNWAPLAAATPELPATEGLSLAFSAGFPGQSTLVGKDRPPHGRSPRSTSTRIATSTSSSPPSARSPRSSSTTAAGPSTPRPLARPSSGRGRLDACSSPTSTRTAVPTSSAFASGQPAQAWRNASTRAGRLGPDRLGEGSLDGPGVARRDRRRPRPRHHGPTSSACRRPTPSAGRSGPAGHSGTTARDRSPSARCADGPEAPARRVRRGRPRRRPAARPRPRSAMGRPPAWPGTSATASTGWRSTSPAAGRPRSTRCGPTPKGSAPGSRWKGRGSTSRTTTPRRSPGPASRSARSSSAWGRIPRPPCSGSAGPTA